MDGNSANEVPGATHPVGGSARAGSADNPRNDTVATIVALCWLLSFAASVPRDFATPPSGSRPRVRCSVNPNTAPWWELTILPGIGETRAREIVRYREKFLSDRHHDPSLPVFRNLDDLDRISGIGPKTLEELAPEVDLSR